VYVFKKYILKIFLILFFALSNILFFGCEQVEIINPDTTFKENVVVRAELLAGENFAGVTFTKTLPLDIAYSISAAEIRNVTAYLKINKIQIVPLHYTSNGIYKPLYDLKIKTVSHTNCLLLIMKNLFTVKQEFPINLMLQM